MLTQTARVSAATKSALQAVETLEARRTSLDAARDRARLWKHLPDTADYRRYKEPDAKAVSETLRQVRVARARIAALTPEALALDLGELGRLRVGAKGAARLRALLYRRLNATSPYFTQMAARNILWKEKKHSNQAWRRTCSLHSFTMALAGLGKDQAAYTGDRTRLVALAATFESDLDSFARLTAIRLPDFLQLVAINETLTASPTSRGFQKHVTQARAAVVDAIKSPRFMAQLAGRFGVAQVKTGRIASSGRLRRPKSKEAKLVWKKTRQATTRARLTPQVKMRIEAENARRKRRWSTKQIDAQVRRRVSSLLRAEQSKFVEDYVRKAYEAAPAKDKVSAAAYKKSVVESLGPLLAAGNQVIGNQPGHYVRLQSIEAEGIVIDDPATRGKDSKLTWTEANDAGHFTVNYQAFG